MKMKDTQELIHRIKEQTTCDTTIFHSKDYACPSITVYLNDLLIAHKIEKKEIIRKLGLDRVYGYQILNGTRKPPRRILIRLAMLLKLSPEETNRLLKIGRKEILYPRIPEDAMAILVLEKGLGPDKYEELLESFA